MGTSSSATFAGGGVFAEESGVEARRGVRAEVGGYEEVSWERGEPESEGCRSGGLRDGCFAFNKGSQSKRRDRLRKRILRLKQPPIPHHQL